MTLEIGIVLGLITIAVVLFASDRVRVDLVAMLVMGALLVTRIIEPEEAFAGFSNVATVTIAAMFVLSEGLYRTGAVNFVGLILGRVGRRSHFLAITVLMITVGAISAFINNTAAVAVFLPIVLEFSRRAKISPSKLLIPLSFAAILGGTCTLIGTSTNVLVSSIAEAHGEEAFGMFEFTKVGLVIFGAGLVYMLVVGVRIIPERRRPSELTRAFGMGKYMTEVTIEDDSPSIGRRLDEAPLVKDLQLEIVELIRDGRRILVPSGLRLMRAGDRLRVRGGLEKIKALQESEGIRLDKTERVHDEDLTTRDALVVEAVVAPNSPLEGRTLDEVEFREFYQAALLAIRHRDQVLHENLGSTVLRAGDAVLVELRREHLNQMRESDDFVLVSEIEVPVFRKGAILRGAAILAGVIGATTFGDVPIAVSAALGAVLMVVSRCLTMEEAYKAIQWQVIFLLAGVLTLGVALEKTGAADIIATGLADTVGVWGPTALVSAFFMVTALLTGIMSNTATAALLAPIALVAARDLGYDPRGLLMAVTFGASASFYTPVGYQTNTLIYGPGQYRFGDFVRVGGPLNLLVWLVATFTIPRIFPLV